MVVVVLFCNGICFLVYGLGFFKDEGLVKLVFWEGDFWEFFCGFLYYVVVLVFSIILFWCDFFVGVMVFVMMCGGDGIVDIVGCRFGFSKLFWNLGKSWVGSIVMFLFGLLVLFGCLCYFFWMGFYELDMRGIFIWVVEVLFVVMVVELFFVLIKFDDNVMVLLMIVVVGMFFFFFGGSVFGFF